MSKCGDKACKTYFQSSETGLELNFSIEQSKKERKVDTKKIIYQIVFSKKEKPPL